MNRIIGSPAGYVGSDSHAELPFDALESNPYQIILLDKFEKEILQFKYTAMKSSIAASKPKIKPPDAISGDELDRIADRTADQFIVRSRFPARHGSYRPFVTRTVVPPPV